MAMSEAMVASDIGIPQEPLDTTVQEPLDATVQENFLEGTGLDSHMIGARAKPRLTEEERLAREVARRRQVELERRARIFDAKRRTIGLDIETLDAQRAENRHRRQQDRAEARAGDREMRQTNQALTMLEMDKQRARREMERDCKEFSLASLNFQSRREFDLNDPHAVRKGTPTRLGDQDLRLGPASLQRFSGEDLTKEERKRQQQLETVHFLEQQRFEKAMLSKAEGEEMKAFARDVAEITQLRNEMEEHEVQGRRNLQKLQQDSNYQLALDKQRQKKLDTLAEMERNEHELGHHARDPFLNEISSRRMFGPAPGADDSPSGVAAAGGGTAAGAGAAVGASGRGGGNFKGSTREERVMIARQQLAQAEQDETKKDIDRLEDYAYAKQQEQTRKQMIAVEREKARMKRALAEQVARENRVLKMEQKANTKRMDQLFTNEFRPEFFEQFGTHTR